MARARDPYYIVQEDTAETLLSVEADFAKWRGLPGSSPARAALEERIREELRGLDYTVREIEKSVDAAEANFQRFRLDAAEVASRRRWLADTRRQLNGILAGISRGDSREGTAPKAAAGFDVSGPEAGVRAVGGRGAGTSPPGPPQRSPLPPPSRLHEENERFLEGESQRQQALMTEQDARLDELGDHVVRIGALGREMGTELTAQGQLLDEFDEELQGTQTRLAAAQKKVQHVLDRAGAKGQWFVVLILLGLLVLLIILVLA